MMNELSLLDTLFNDGYAALSQAAMYRVPSVNVKQTKESYVLEMELPGLEEKDIDLSIRDNVLTIASVDEKSKKEEKTEDTFLIREISKGSFKRSFTLPRDVDTDSTEASFKNGILYVTIQRKEDKGVKKIAVKVA